MPLYEYRCKACGHRFEKIQSFSAPDEKECPICHAEVERLISAPAVHFSGSGFYSTDYKAKSPSAPKSTDGGTKEASSGKSDGAAATGDSAPKTASSSESSSSSSPPASTSSPTASGDK